MENIYIDGICIIVVCDGCKRYLDNSTGRCWYVLPPNLHFRVWIFCHRLKEQEHSSHSWKFLTCYCVSTILKKLHAEIHMQMFSYISSRCDCSLTMRKIKLSASVLANGKGALL